MAIFLSAVKILLLQQPATPASAAVKARTHCVAGKHTLAGVHVAAL